MTPVVILWLAIAIDLLVGDPPNAWHPTGWMGCFIGWGAAHAPRRGAVAQTVYGTILALVGVALFSLPVAFALKPLHAWNEVAFVALNAVGLKMTFALRGLTRAALQVNGALMQGGLPEARRLVASHLVSRDTQTLDESHVASATIESVAENLVDSFVAPLFFFALFGLPGALAYRFVNTADAMIGYHGPTEYLGKAAARQDDLLNLVPARLTGLLIVAAATASRTARQAWNVLRRDHKQTASPNAGWPMSAMAGGLGICLEKIGHYRLGHDFPMPTRAHIPRTFSLSLAAVVLAAVLLSGVCVLRGAVWTTLS